MNPLNTQPYRLRPPRSCATRGMIVSTARASAATNVVVSTSPVVSARCCGLQRPLGGGAAAPTVHGTLQLLDDAGIEGELAVRQTRSGRVEVTQMWGRPQSVREEFRRLRAQ